MRIAGATERVDHGLERARHEEQPADLPLAHDGGDLRRFLAHVGRDVGADASGEARGQGARFERQLA